MKAEILIKQFIENNNIKLKNENLFCEDNVLYSYGYHFPLALKLNDGFIVVNLSKYSSSTSKQQYYLNKNVVENKKLYVDTFRLKEMIQNNIKSVSEIICEVLVK